jgi:toxin-antitoxin system PIN domain toxin
LSRAAGFSLFVVDTNILLYAADRGSPAHARCRELLEQWRAQTGAWYLSWGIVYEFLRVTTHASVFARPWTAAQAWEFVQALLASPGLGMLTQGGRHAAVAAEVVAEMPLLAGNLLHDAHTAILMREHGVRRIYTRDADFHRFPFIEAIDPLA